MFNTNKIKKIILSASIFASACATELKDPVCARVCDSVRVGVSEGYCDLRAESTMTDCRLESVERNELNKWQVGETVCARVEKYRMCVAYHSACQTHDDTLMYVSVGSNVVSEECTER